MGLLDLPAPLLALLDRGLSMLLAGDGLRVAVYGLLSGVLCMFIYRLVSDQQRLAELAGQSRLLRQELARYDGPFEGLVARAGAMMRLNMRHLRLSLFPALYAGLPILFVLPWLSNQFGVEAPAPGQTVTIRAEGLERDFATLHWHPPALETDAHMQTWHIAWPAAEERSELRQGGNLMLTLPLDPPVTVVHRKLPIWNLLLANPAGYLDPDAPLFALHLDLPERQLHRIGPTWLRGWLAVYLLPLLGTSLLLKWRWRMH